MSNTDFLEHKLSFSGKILFVLVVLMLYLKVGFAQNDNNDIKYDCKRDTLIVVGDKTLCENKNLISRALILDSDSLQINHKGLEISSYRISSFTLGYNLDIEIRSSLITQEFKKAVAPGEVIYKYINIEDIVLKDKQNNYIKPTLQNLKIVFLD